MRLRSEKNLKIVAATGVTLFSLVASFAATYAWLVTKQESQASITQFRVTSDLSSCSSITIHRCILNQSNDSKYAFDTENAIDNNNLVIPDYSELNTSQPLLLLFTLSGNESSSADKIKLTASSSSDTYVEEITDDNYNSFPFSSAVYFQSIYFTTPNFPFDNVTRSNLSSLTSFVEISGNVFSGFNKDIDLFDGESLENPPSDPLTYVGVVMDYYDLAIKYISFYNTGNERRLNFDYDFKMSIS